jgi:DNA modification methylase
MIKNGNKSENILCCGDNLDFMKQLLEDGFKDSIDFIYIDPPYFTGSDYKQYQDKWDSMDEYLSMLKERFVLMKELLSPTGCIAVHLDWHSVHYVKVEMDKIFGYNHFVNELIWSYKSGGASTRSFAKKHDNILVYSKTSKYKFNPQKEKSYNRGGKPYRFKGVEEFSDEHGWYTMVNHKDVFTIDMVGRTSAERTGYPTQKPEKLMELMISAYTDEGDLCADFFAGSGSFAVAAAKKNRSYICCDSAPEALEVQVDRLSKISSVFKIIQ